MIATRFGHAATGRGLRLGWVNALCVSAALVTIIASGAALAQPKTASEATTKANQSLLDYLPFGDDTDFENARRGFIASIEDGKIKNAQGKTVFDIQQFDFVKGDAPATVNPSLWRQSEINAIHGLFEVVPGVYQVRAFDLANVSFIRGETGWIVVDPLTTVETAKAAIALVRAKVEDLPVSAIIFTHSHVDHFGGIKGVDDPRRLASGDIPIIAPEGFFIEAVNENLMAGNQMSRRASYMYGNVLDKSPTGSVGSGLGTTTSAGAVTIVQPTREIRAKTVAGDEPEALSVDGVEMDFFYTPEAEAPAEMMFWIPKYNALMQAEEIAHTMHNLYTLRGA